MSYFKPALEIDLADDEELIVVATIAITNAGEHKMHVADIEGSTVKISAEEKARALRILATAVEAEAIANDSSS